MLERSADVDLKYRGEKTSLHIASSYGYIKVMQTVLKYGASIDTQTIDGLTPLMYAVTGNHKECVLELLNRKAETTFQTNTDGSSAFHIAAKRGFTDILRILLQHRNSIGVGDIRGRLPLHVAAVEGHLDCIKILLEHNAKINVRDNQNWTPLMCASFFGHTEVAKQLIENRADINAFGDKQLTALHIASFKGHFEITRLLIDNKDVVDCFNKYGNTPLQLAIQENHIAIVALLLQNGATPNSVTHVENTDYI